MRASVLPGRRRSSGLGVRGSPATGAPAQAALDMQRADVARSHFAIVVTCTSFMDKFVKPLPPIVTMLSTAVAEVLQHPDLCGLPPDNVAHLKNPSFKTLRAAIRAFGRRMREVDSLLLIISSRGVRIRYGLHRGSYVMLNDTLLSGTNSDLAVTSLNVKSLKALLSKENDVETSKVCIILDVCHRDVDKPVRGSAFSQRMHRVYDKFYTQVQAACKCVVLGPYDPENAAKAVDTKKFPDHMDAMGPSHTLTTDFLQDLLSGLAGGAALAAEVGGCTADGALRPKVRASIAAAAASAVARFHGLPVAPEVAAKQAAATLATAASNGQPRVEHPKPPKLRQVGILALWGFMWRALAVRQARYLAALRVPVPVPTLCPVLTKLAPTSKAPSLPSAPPKLGKQGGVEEAQVPAEPEAEVEEVAAVGDDGGHAAAEETKEGVEVGDAVPGEGAKEEGAAEEAEGLDPEEAEELDPEEAGIDALLAPQPTGEVAPEPEAEPEADEGQAMVNDEELKALQEIEEYMKEAEDKALEKQVRRKNGKQLMEWVTPPITPLWDIQQVERQVLSEMGLSEEEALGTGAIIDLRLGLPGHLPPKASICPASHILVGDWGECHNLFLAPRPPIVPSVPRVATSTSHTITAIWDQDPHTGFPALYNELQARGHGRAVKHWRLVSPPKPPYQIAKHHFTWLEQYRNLMDGMEAPELAGIRKAAQHRQGKLQNKRRKARVLPLMVPGQDATTPPTVDLDPAVHFLHTDWRVQVTPPLQPAEPTQFVQALAPDCGYYMRVRSWSPAGWSSFSDQSSTLYSRRVTHASASEQAAKASQVGAAELVSLMRHNPLATALHIMCMKHLLTHLSHSKDTITLVKELISAGIARYVVNAMNVSVLNAECAGLALEVMAIMCETGLTITKAESATVTLQLRKDMVTAVHTVLDTHPDDGRVAIFGRRLLKVFGISFRGKASVVKAGGVAGEKEKAPLQRGVEEEKKEE